MINRKSFSKAEILKHHQTYPKADPRLIERQIYAFELLGLLSATGKEFVFKGGTSLLLLLPTARRLSIDIDIVGNFEFNDLAAAVRGSVFTSVEEDRRERTQIPKRHFKFYYTSAIDDRTTYVLLDILYGEHGYSVLQSLPITSTLFTVSSKMTVALPTAEGILGDKLTAFAPATIGIPYGHGKSMEIIKQLHDVGELFDASNDMSIVSHTYQAIQKLEATYRGENFSIESTTDDTINAAFLLCQSELKGALKDSRSDELQRGIRQIQNYLLGKPFRLEDGKIAAAKAALLASLIKMNMKEIKIIDIRYNASFIELVRDAVLSNERQILNRLKSTQTEAFYYWWLIERYTK